MPLTSTGFVARTQIEIIEALRAAFIGSPLFGPETDYSDEGPLGQIIGIISGSLAELEEACADVYHAYDPLSADEAALRNLGTLTVGPSQDATYSRLFVTITSTLVTTIPAGSIIASVTNPTVRFVLAADHTTNAGTQNDVLFLAENPGPVTASAGDVTTIVTSVTGWSTVTNPSDAIAGDSAESVTQYRARILGAPAALGGTTVDGLAADLLALNTSHVGRPVIAVKVLANETDLESNGVPPHAVECIIHDLNRVANNTIAQRIWDSLGIGIRTVGNTSGVATDADGGTHVIAFSRPVPVDIDVMITVYVDMIHASEAEIRQAIIDRASAYISLGQDAIVSQYVAAALAQIGVRDASAAHVRSPAGTFIQARLPMALRELARYTTPNIMVTILPYEDL